MARILRSAPWLSVSGASAGEAALFGVAVITHRSTLSLPATLLAIAIGGSAAAYILDEAATAICDATPTGRCRRAVWRTPILTLPGAVAVIGLTALDRADPATHWLRLVPLATATLAIGVAAAAVLRAKGWEAGGDLAAASAALTILTIAESNPLQRWVTTLPLVGTAHPARSLLLWLAVAAGCALVALVCTRDPGRYRSRPPQPG